MNKYTSLIFAVLSACTTNFSYHEDATTDGEVDAADGEADAVEESEADVVEEDATEADAVEADETDANEGDTPEEEVVDPCAGLTRWFLDNDDDGYGQDEAWVCAETAPSGYAPEGGDCCDENVAVHPGQEEWFTTAYACPYTSWDYNCDGTVNESMSFATEQPTEFCTSLVEVACAAHSNSWWFVNAPACGAVGTLIWCAWEAGSCHGYALTAVRQGCH